MALKLSELIATYGDDKVQFQNLDQSAISMNMNGATTKITFILALTIAAFRIIEAHEHTKAGVFDLVTREAEHD